MPDRWNLSRNVSLLGPRSLPTPVGTNPAHQGIQDSRFHLNPPGFTTYIIGRISSPVIGGFTDLRRLPHASPPLAPPTF
jgi:hypothetical protein